MAGGHKRVTVNVTVVGSILIRELIFSVFSFLHSGKEE